MSPFYGFAILIEVICLAYFYLKLFKFKYIKDLNLKSRIIIPLIICLILFGISFFRIGTICIIYAHFFVFMGIVDIVFLFINHKRENKIVVQTYISFGFTFIYILISLFLGFKVFETDYSINTNKMNRSLKIAQITDVHLGNTFDGNGFKKYIEEINQLNPDLLVVTGDFVDDETKYNEMVVACQALGEAKTKYGVYFIHGNHDKGYYPKHRKYTKEDLNNELLKNNVNILEDEYILVDNDFYIIGRKDKSDKSRIPMDKLMEGVDTNKYTILLDHQPNDYNNEKNKVDLVLSGHTHGGNILPVNFIVYAANDYTYGKKVIDNTTFIVSSGISCWGMTLNNVTIQEYVIININES